MAFNLNFWNAEFSAENERICLISNISINTIQMDKNSVWIDFQISIELKTCYFVDGHYLLSCMRVPKTRTKNIGNWNPIGMKATSNVRRPMPTVQYYYYHNKNTSMCPICGVSLTPYCELWYAIWCWLPVIPNYYYHCCMQIEPFFETEIIFQGGSTMTSDIRNDSRVTPNLNMAKVDRSVISY